MGLEQPTQHSPHSFFPEGLGGAGCWLCGHRLGTWKCPPPSALTGKSSLQRKERLSGRSPAADLRDCSATSTQFGTRERPFPARLNFSAVPPCEGTTRVYNCAVPCVDGLGNALTSRKGRVN